MAEDERSRLVHITVGQSAAGEDEDLPDPNGGRARSPRLPLLLAAAALVGAILVTRALAHGASPNGPGPASTGSLVARTPPVAGAPVRVDTPTTALPDAAYQGAGPRWCPDAGDGQSVCSSVSDVPAQVLAAVRARFPAGGHVSAFEETLRDVGFGPGGLWYREVRVRQGSRAVTVQVYRPTGSERTQVRTHADTRGSTLVVTRLVGGFVVRVEVRMQVKDPAGRATDVIPPDGLLAFAADPRLRAAAAAHNDQG